MGWLSDREKAIAVDRIKTNSQGIGNYQWQWYQVRETFIDPRTYSYFLFSMFMNIPNGGIGIFGSIIINVSPRPLYIFCVLAELMSHRTSDSRSDCHCCFKCHSE